MPTKEQFAAYVRVQRLGLWNMFDPQAVEARGLDKATYIAVMKNYSQLEKLYPEVVKEENNA